MGANIETAIAKWGNSTGIRIPKAVAERAELHEGDAVEIAAEGPGVIIVRAVKRELRLADLVSRITPKNRHSEEDWGARQGREIW